MSAIEVLEQFRKLPVEEQREVFARIRDEFDDGLMPGEAELIDSRLHDHLKNPDDVVSWEEAKAKLDVKYTK